MHQRLVLVSFPQKMTMSWSRLFTIRAETLFSTKLCNLIVSCEALTRCLGCARRLLSRLHVIAPYKLTLCLIIINECENKCTTAITIKCKPILTSWSCLSTYKCLALVSTFERLVLAGEANVSVSGFNV